MADLIERYKITANLPSVLMNYCNRFNSKQLESITEMIYELENSIESADVQPVDRWISVDERLPKTGESVLVYVAINKNLKGFGECKPEIRIGWLDDGGEWALQFSNMDYSEVLCWLPLPEPPKDGDTNG